jgi:hypothetical protein
VDRDQVRSSEPTKDYEERQFISETDYSQAALDKIDISSLNLFGAPLEDTIGKEALKDVASNAET